MCAVDGGGYVGSDDVCTVPKNLAFAPPFAPFIRPTQLREHYILPKAMLRVHHSHTGYNVSVLRR